ncbi:hypothetical protein [Spiroplasma chrysopicola]|uniref:Transmembrane protein n=1 Tax=Spiroplasma chrysopicola DF-1 TaxID=1276227 RepID=R4U283_9MOLU|nr:hypothetical protein [Spiroplasma chrysopicola]AGM25462.1 hypothetical protein SCHRY_v1c08890 [Spiroplasma chrysopicola DF-1]
MVKLIFIAIAFSIYYYWIFSSTGAVLTEMLKLRTKNIYFGMIIGFFFYFAAVSLFLMPFQLIPDLRYIFLVYLLGAVNVLYSLVLLILIRFWFNIRLLDKNHAIFLFAMAIFILVYYFKNYFISPAGQNLNTSYILTFFTRDEKDLTKFVLDPSVIIGNTRALASLGWFTNVSMWFTITNLDPNEIILNLLDILDAMVFAALFVTLLNNFSRKNNNNLVIGFFSLLILTGSKLLIYYFGYDAWHPENMITNLFFVIFIILSIYTNAEYRNRNMPWIIGIIFTSYITFDWDATYIILFLVYVSGWITMLKYQVNFLKDLVKFTVFPTICFIFYNIWYGTIWLIFVFLGLMLIMIILSFLLYRNYARIFEIEKAIYSHNRALIFVIPSLFTIASVLILLASGKIKLDFWNLEAIASSIYTQLELAKIKDLANSIFLIISFIFLGFGLLWIFFMERIPNFSAKTSINMLAILTVTFFNPLVGRFLIWIFNDRALLNNATVFIVAILVAINTSVYAVKIKQFKKITWKPQQKQQNQINYKQK